MTFHLGSSSQRWERGRARCAHRELAGLRRSADRRRESVRRDQRAKAGRCTPPGRSIDVARISEYQRQQRERRRPSTMRNVPKPRISNAAIVFVGASLGIPATRRRSQRRSDLGESEEDLRTPIAPRRLTDRGSAATARAPPYHRPAGGRGVGTDRPPDGRPARRRPRPQLQPHGSVRV
jgi:hypothetical protein